ncbi:hypothetical protein QE152_g32010 [Popillia japonica]|uniref:Tyr recombinase domain-containing protein n=1 Tax=Popillia japonica TaxID=7064 RepID=A0AAW1J0F4_POPJA
MYTGHCFRRSAATMLANFGADLVTVKRLGCWKSSSVAETYIEESVGSKIAASKRILVGPENQPSTSVQLSNQTTRSSGVPLLPPSVYLLDRKINPVPLYNCPTKQLEVVVFHM